MKSVWEVSTLCDLRGPLRAALPIYAPAWLVHNTEASCFLSPILNKFRIASERSLYILVQHEYDLKNKELKYWKWKDFH
jgi:hypothetical protein